MKSNQGATSSIRSGPILFLWGVSVCSVVFLSLVPRVELPVDFRNADKVYHCAAYSWLALLPVMGFADRRIALFAALSMILLGLLLEVGQYFIPGRMFSIPDILANMLGVALGIFSGRFIGKRLG
ncbi:MAG: VanZ family protein [Smithellaceae bacterium]|jgi:VanZ family protein|nr:VanZ family protein [Smithellaceae bacterium]